MHYAWGCSGDGSGLDEEDTDNQQVTEGDGNDTNTAGRIAFPELQGRWLNECELFDDDAPEDGYEQRTIDVTGNDYVLEVVIYSDSNCVTRLTRGFLQGGSSVQITGILERPEGTANTGVGAVPFINIVGQNTTIDNEPLVASVEAFFPNETTYTIVYVDGNTMYLGAEDLDDDDSGTTPETRDMTLDFDYPWVKQ